LRVAESLLRTSGPQGFEVLFLLLHCHIVAAAMTVRRYRCFIMLAGRPKLTV